jgi:antitoxin ParD1/3/4
MRTNIVIDDALMAKAMDAGGFKTKREAVEEGLRMIARRKTYQGLLALRGTLEWDDSDEGWAKRRAEQNVADGAQAFASSALTLHEPAAVYRVNKAV